MRLIQGSLCLIWTSIWEIRVYNTRRLHSGIDYRTPLEAERLAALSTHVLTQTSGALSLTAHAARPSASPHPQIS